MAYTELMRDRVHRYIHFSLGAACIVLAAIGAVLPLLPTTIFVILAAFFFTKGSPRLRAWLIEHAHFGPVIIAWEETGAIPPRIKRIAVGMMAVAFGLSLVLGLSVWVLALQAACMICAAIYVLTRPDA